MKEAPNPVETTFQACLEEVKAKVKTSKARVATLTHQIEVSEETTAQTKIDRQAEIVKLAILTRMEAHIQGGQQTIVADATTKLSNPTEKA